VLLSAVVRRDWLDNAVAAVNPLCCQVLVIVLVLISLTPTQRIMSGRRSFFSLSTVRYIVGRAIRRAQRRREGGDEMAARGRFLSLSSPPSG
jgi:hypothetical protein